MNMLFLFSISFLGMFLHFVKKKVRGETISDIFGFFRDHVKSTIIALGATFISFIIYMQLVENGVVALDYGYLFGLGWFNDSFFNKFETNGKTNNGTNKI